MPAELAGRLPNGSNGIELPSNYRVWSAALVNSSQLVRSADGREALAERFGVPTTFYGFGDYDSVQHHDTITGGGNELWLKSEAPKIMPLPTAQV